MLKTNQILQLFFAVFLTLTWSNQLNSQTTDQDSLLLELKPTKKKINYGFTLCLNNDIVNANHDPSQKIYVKNRNAIRLGIFAELLSHRTLSYRLMTDMIHRRNYINVGYIGSSPISRYQINPFSIDVLGHLKYNMVLGPGRIYGLAGFSLNFPLGQRNLQFNEYPIGSAYNAEIGIGFEFPLMQFDLCPELRYSHGLNDINMHPGLNGLHLNSLVFALVFKG